MLRVEGHGILRLEYLQRRVLSWEHNRSMPDVHDQLLLAAALGIDIDKARTGDSPR
jgi:hypothetical protein